MLTTPQKQSHVKTSSDLLQDYNSSRFGNQLQPPTVQINHQSKQGSIINSNNNLSNFEIINQNQNVQPQQLQSNLTQSNVQTKLYQSNQVPTFDRNNLQTYYQEKPQVITTSVNPNQNVYNSSAIFKSNNNNNNKGYENMNIINNKIEEHQRNSEKKGNNKLYDSFTGRERDFGSPNQNQDEHVKKSKQFNVQNNFISQENRQLTSKEIGQKLLMEEQRRYFSPGPEQLSNIVTLNRNRGNYKGQVRQIRDETILEGIGQLESYNGDIYMGYFWRNYMHGDGYLLRANGDFYNGKFQNDKIQGYGRYYFQNGDLYEGNFYNGQRQSEKAQFYCSSEDAWYEIPFDQDRKHGKGTKKDSHGHVTNVEYFQDVQQTEEGSKLYHSKLNEFGDYYISKVKEEEKVKKSKIPQQSQPQKRNVHQEAMTKLDQFILEKLPLYSDEKPPEFPIQELAVYKFHDGSYYAGYWKDGIQHGFGNYYDSQVGFYEGNFYNGLKNGEGNMQYLNGDEYVGQWLNDLKHDEQALYFNFRKQKKCIANFDSGNLIQVIGPAPVQVPENQQYY